METKSLTYWWLRNTRPNLLLDAKCPIDLQILENLKSARHEFNDLEEKRELFDDHHCDGCVALKSHKHKLQRELVVSKIMLLFSVAAI